MRSVFLLPLLVAASASSQAPANAPATFSTKVNLVTVPVVVRDPEGHAIGTLKKEDFQLFDKGKPQVISEFTIEKSPAPPVPIEGTATVSGMRKGGEGAAGPARFVAYLFDDMHTGFADLVRVRAAAEQHVEESLGPGDRAAIYTTSGLNTLDFTDDKDKLRETMKRITPRSKETHSAADCPDVSVFMADAIVNKGDPTALGLVSAAAAACMKVASKMLIESEARAAANRMLSLADAQAQSSLATLGSTIMRMSTVPGQRTIVLVSPGFLLTNDRRQQQASLIDLAIRAHVTVSALDARGLYTVMPGGGAAMTQYRTEAAQIQGDVLSELADGTGGTFFHNSDDLLEGFRRTGAFPEFTYMLGFVPQDLKFDGSFHGLKVTLTSTADTRGFTLHARRGYTAPKHSNDAAADAKEELGAMIFSRAEISDIPVTLETKFVKANENTAKLSVVAHLDMKPIRFQKAAELNRTTVMVAAAVFDRNGLLVTTLQKDFVLSLTDARLAAARAAGVALPLAFDIAPGSYIVRLVVRDSDGKTAAHNSAVEIP